MRLPQLKTPHKLHLGDRSTHQNPFHNALLPLAIAFGSGLLMGLAPAPVNAYPLAWVALAPLWVMVLGKEKSTLEKETVDPIPRPLRLRWQMAIALPLAWGIGYHGLALSWITGLHPLMWLGIPWLASIAITLFAWGFITLWGAALIVIWVWGMKWVEQHLTQRFNHPRNLHLIPHIPHPTPHTPHLQRILLAAALWCGLEWIWSLGSLYWTSLSYTQSPGNLWLLHLGQLSGPSTVTAAIVVVNGLFAEAWLCWRGAFSRSPKFYGISATAVIFLVTLHLIGYGLYSRPIAQPDVMALKIGIIQGNVPTRLKLSGGGLRRATTAYTQGYETLAEQGVNAVLTPEGALPFAWTDQRRETHPFYRAVLNRRVVAWLGTFTAEKGKLARSLLTLTGDGNTLSRYDKIKLVPLGEYIPFQALLGSIVSLLTPIQENGLPGTLDQQFDTPFGRAIASICYDSAFPAVFRRQAAIGGQFILTASNLDPYSEVLMAQHQAQDIMRAIETDRWAVRATNTGYSGILDPHGRVVWRSQPNVYVVHAETIYRRQTQTLYVRWDDWLTPLLLALVFCQALLKGLRTPKVTA